MKLLKIILCLALLLTLNTTHAISGKNSPLQIDTYGWDEALKLMGSSNTLRITQRDTGFSSKSSKNPVIATFSVSQCCALATYDPTSTKISLSHIDVFTDLNDLSRLANTLCKVKSRSQVRVALVSGNQKLIDNIQMCLKKLGFQNILADLDIYAKHSRGGIHVAIDARDPKVIKSYFDINKLDRKDLIVRINAFLKRKDQDKTLNFVNQE